MLFNSRYTLIFKSICSNFNYCTYNIRNAPTIFALSSGRGKCAVAVIRVSGPDSNDALKSVLGNKKTPEPRMATLRKIYHPETRTLLDTGLVFWYPGPKSFTCEDSFELHVHGGTAVISSVMKALGSINNLRLAKPGEFAYRAFYNGKFDLIQAEGLADLINAETDFQRQQALKQAGGALSEVYNKWRHNIVSIVGRLEFLIDFSETEHEVRDVLTEVLEDVRKLQKQISDHIENGKKCQRLRDGVKVVLVGATNVGKSSILNLISEENIAIVSPEENTTRDVITKHYNIFEFPVILSDTAGVCQAPVTKIEKEAQNKSYTAYEEADLVILVINTEQCIDFLKKHPGLTLTDYIKKYTRKEAPLAGLVDYEERNPDLLFLRPCIVAFNKMDLCRNVNFGGKDCRLREEYDQFVFMSCHDRSGVKEFLEKIRHRLKILCSEPKTEHPFMTQHRHEEHLESILSNLNQFLQVAQNQDPDLGLLGEYLRSAIHQIHNITGNVVSDQTLDFIFKNFCIGK